jgi:hypothetical protein
MAFAKGRAFVILNRMAESGNSEAKKILSNLNSMSQEDLDSKLSTLFGKGGASKEGDTTPKDEKGGKAPEGKEEAPKGTKEPKEGKVVANKDFDPNKEGVQSIFGTEEENAKSKDKQVFNTMEEVAKPKEMTSAKDGIKPIAPKQKINDNNENYLGRKDAMTIRGDDAAKEKELYDFVGSVEKEMPELSSYLAEFETYIDNDDILTVQGFAEYLDAQSENVEDTPEKNAEVRAVKTFVDGKLGRGQATPKEMKSTKEGIKPVVETSAKDFFSNKPMNEGSLKDFVSQNPDFALNDFNKLEDEFETMVDNDGTNSMEVVSQLKEKYKGDATKQQAVNKLEGKEKFRAAAKEYLEKNSGTSPLWAKAGMTGNQKQLDAKATYDAMFDFINDASTIEEAFAEARLYRDGENDKEFLDYLEQRVLGKDNKGSASNPMTSATEGVKPVETKSRYAGTKNYSKTLEKVGNKAIEFLSNDEDKDIAEELLVNYFRSGEGSIYSMLQGIERDYPNDKVKQVARKFGNTISAAQKELGVSSFDDED